MCNVEVCDWSVNQNCMSYCCVDLDVNIDYKSYKLHFHS